MPTNSDRQAAARSIWWALLESVGLALLSLGSVVVYGRLLEPRDFGIVAIALGIVHLFGVLGDSLFAEAIVQRRELSRAHVEAAFATSLGIGVVSAAICWVGQYPAAVWLGEPALAPVVGVIGLSLLCCGVNGVLGAQMRRDMRFKELATRSLVGRIAGAVTGVGMAWGGFGLWGLVGQHMVMTFLSALTLYFLTPDRPLPCFAVAPVRDLLGFGIASVCNHMLTSGTRRVFTILAGYFLGTTALGHLNLAFRIVDVLRDTVASGLGQFTFPLLSRRQSNAGSFASAFRKATSFTTMVALPVFTGILICAPELVVLTFGERWAPAVPLVQILCGQALLYFTRMFAGPAVSAMGRPHLNTVTGLIGSAGTLGIILLVQPDTAVGVALGWTLLTVLPLPYTVWAVRTCAGISFADQAAAAVRPIAASLIMAACLAVLKLILPPETGAAATLALVVPAGVVSYATAIWLLNADTVVDMADFMLAGLRRRRI